MVSVSGYFNERAKDWDVRAEPSGTKHITVATLAGVGPETRVLDVGCGTGIMVPAYMACGAKSVYAVDVSSEMISRAKEKFQESEQLTFECIDVRNIPGQERFDVVVFYNVYPHVKETSGLIEAVHRLLVPGGRFIVAHGMSREQLEAHHAKVPSEVSAELLSPKEEAKAWSESLLFEVDMIGDAHIYFFSGRAV